MIAHLRGSLLSKAPSAAVVECAGVGYEVAITVPAYTALPAEGATVALFIHTHVREDALLLFGFLDRGEKLLFERLISVSGIGPKLAMAVLSGMAAQQLAAAIRGGDHASLTRIPGIGKKTAERVVLELKDKLDGFAAAETPTGVAGGPVAEDVLSAMVNLGYARPAAQKAIETAIRQHGETDLTLTHDFEQMFRRAIAALR